MYSYSLDETSKRFKSGNQGLLGIPANNVNTLLPRFISSWARILYRSWMSISSTSLSSHLILLDFFSASYFSPSFHHFEVSEAVDGLEGVGYERRQVGTFTGATSLDGLLSRQGQNVIVVFIVSLVVLNQYTYNTMKSSSLVKSDSKSLISKRSFSSWAITGKYHFECHLRSASGASMTWRVSQISALLENF